MQRGRVLFIEAGRLWARLGSDTVRSASPRFQHRITLESAAERLSVTIPTSRRPFLYLHVVLTGYSFI